MRRIINENMKLCDLVREIEINKQTSGIYWYKEKRIQIKLL